MSKDLSDIFTSLEELKSAKNKDNIYSKKIIGDDNKVESELVEEKGLGALTIKSDSVKKAVNIEVFIIFTVVM